MSRGSSSSRSFLAVRREPSQNTWQHSLCLLVRCTSVPDQSRGGHNHWMQTGSPVEGGREGGRWGGRDRVREGGGGGME